MLSRSPGASTRRRGSSASDEAGPSGALVYNRSRGSAAGERARTGRRGRGRTRGRAATDASTSSERARGPRRHAEVQSLLVEGGATHPSPRSSKPGYADRAAILLAPIKLLGDPREEHRCSTCRACRGSGSRAGGSRARPHTGRAGERPAAARVGRQPPRRRPTREASDVHRADRGRIGRCRRAFSAADGKTRVWDRCSTMAGRAGWSDSARASPSTVSA